MTRWFWGSSTKVPKSARRGLTGPPGSNPELSFWGSSTKVPKSARRGLTGPPGSNPELRVPGGRVPVCLGKRLRRLRDTLDDSLLAPGTFERKKQHCYGISHLLNG